MKQKRTERAWHPAAQCVLGILVVALLTFVAFRFQASAATAVLLYLVVIVLMSLWAPFVPAAVVSCVAVFCLQYFFVSPVLSFGADTLDLVALASSHSSTQAPPLHSAEAVIPGRLVQATPDQLPVAEQTS